MNPLAGNGVRTKRNKSSPTPNVGVGLYATYCTHFSEALLPAVLAASVLRRLTNRGVAITRRAGTGAAVFEGDFGDMVLPDERQIRAGLHVDIRHRGVWIILSHCLQLLAVEKVARIIAIDPPYSMYHALCKESII